MQGTVGELIEDELLVTSGVDESRGPLHVIDRTGNTSRKEAVDGGDGSEEVEDTDFGKGKTFSMN